MSRCKNIDHCKGTHPTICEQEGCARESAELRRQQLQAEFNQVSAENYIEYLEADNKYLRARLEQVEKDAARYRWLRESHFTISYSGRREQWVYVYRHGTLVERDGFGSLDEAVDAAIAAGGKHDE